MERLRASLAVLLCLSLSIPSAFGFAQTAPSSTSQSPGHPATRQPYQSGQLRGDERILHALNRFTFGPRQGDLEAVQAMGLEKWFTQQLHPETIDNSGLQARLAQFPAMQWSPQDLLYRLPSNAVIRQAADGKAPIPDAGALHSIYINEIARYENRQQFQITRILALPPQERVTRLATMQQPEFDNFRKTLKGPQRIALTIDLNPAQKVVVGALEAPQRVVNEELAAQRLTRDIYSNAQLQEVMTDFWLNHFNVYLHKNDETPYYLVSYERDVIRPRVLGKFEDLLEATAHSPAMLLYLDNSSSMGPDSPAAEHNKIAAARRPDAKKAAPEGLNENYARELMELHTLGVNGGYTQADVTQVARVLTGWTVDRPQRGGGFKFDENRHEPGSKKSSAKRSKSTASRKAANKLPGIAIAWNVQSNSTQAIPVYTPINDASASPSVVHIPDSIPTPEAEEQRLESLLVAGGVSPSTRAAVLDQFRAQSAQNQVPGQSLAAVAKPMNPSQAAAVLEKQDKLLAGLLLGSPEFQRR